MANTPALSTAKCEEIKVGSAFGLSFQLLDVLHANQFEGQPIDPKDADQAEENFYRGAPPKWLNFHISEQAQSDSNHTPFIKRDGYDTVVEQINQRRKRPGISTVKLFHQPGCGGTTLAMKVLWDLRKKFRSAVLTGSTSDITDVAEEVVYLFTAGDYGYQNTVLLLVNDEQILENLQDAIMTTIAEQTIVTRVMPVVIFLSCIRKDTVLQSDHVSLSRALSDTEKQKFDQKKQEICSKFSDKYSKFHGFNIMQSNFSKDYVEQACRELENVRSKKKPKKIQLTAFLSLLNAYVPGSYLLESQCMDFFKHDDYMHGDFSLEDRLGSFSHLIITYRQDRRPEKQVCMAHPMIAQCCINLMVEAGIKRSDTARLFLTCLCKDDVPPVINGFVKDMLTKRRPKQRENQDNPVNTTETTKDQERFSRLILDIQKFERNVQSASVLKMASKMFNKNPFFPQALARFYCTELKYYHQAELWANEAKLRDPQNSFIADTLGQVHKNHLKNVVYDTNQREILKLASKAIEAFKDEERLAENEQGEDMEGHGNSKFSNSFNSRGLFGYLQVCNLVFENLFHQNNIWSQVLTKQVSLGSVLENLGDNKLFRFYDLINSFRDEVERKCAFFDKYLTYSQPDMKKNDPSYISDDTTICYQKFVGQYPSKHFQEKGADLIQKLKQNLADTSARVLSCLDKGCTESDIKEIVTWWEEIFLQKDSVMALAIHILAHIMLRNMGAILPPENQPLTAFKEKMPLIPEDSLELQLLTLLLCWPADSEDKCVLDFSVLISRMHRSYENAYKKHFRSRHLRPLFFIGKGQDLDRIVHRKILEKMVSEENEEENQHWSTKWSDENIFYDAKVQERLRRVEGVVRSYKIFATVGVGGEIEVDANLRNKLWITRPVTFYLGFTIRGPVAFDIQTKPEGNVPIAEPERSEVSAAPVASTEVTTRGQHFIDRHRTALITRVSDTGTILKKLKDQGVILDDRYQALRVLNTGQDQMSGILQCLSSVGSTGKDALFEILKKMKSTRPLIAELQESE